VGWDAGDWFFSFLSSGGRRSICKQHASSWTLLAQSCDLPLRRFGIYRIATTQAIAKRNHNRGLFLERRLKVAIHRNRYLIRDQAVQSVLPGKQIL